jgi:20S proteasome subunit beta 1
MDFAGYPGMGMDCMMPMQEPMEFAKHVEPGCPYRADDVMKPETAVKTGTTIMAVQYDGGVVMGADTRTSTGDYVANRASRKISKVHDKIFVCRCGSAADTQALTGFVINYLTQHAVELPPGELPTVNTAASLFRLIAYNNKDNLMAGLIVAGYDEKRGGQVWSIPLGGTLHRVPFAIDGSGSGYISGMVDSLYRPTMTKDEALALVQKSIAHAMSRDGSSGGMIRTLVIDKDGLDESVIPGNKLPFGP